MVVAFGATDAHAKKYRRHSVHTVKGVSNEDLLFDSPTLTGCWIHPDVTRGNFHVKSWIWHKVASKLPLGERVKREVLVEGTNNPIPVGIYAALVVKMKAMGVAIANCIEPITSLVLAISFAGK